VRWRCYCAGPVWRLRGITTVADDGGQRAGFVRYVLALAGRDDIPVAAGANVADGHFRYVPGYALDRANWGAHVPPAPGAIAEAIALLKRSADQGATLVGIGQFTNFALLEHAHSGILRQTALYLMGGSVFDPPPGFPVWPNEDDYNIQLDSPSAQVVLERSEPTLIPVAMTCQTALRRADLPRLAGAGALGALIVRQAEFCARTDKFDQVYGARYAGLPDDLINFQHDGLACAIACGWRDGVTISNVPLQVEMRDGWLHEVPDPAGRPLRVVTQVDVAAFHALWLDVLCGAQ
jgi:inosine-uridine nucleoside N-ribohydrolase